MEFSEKNLLLILGSIQIWLLYTIWKGDKAIFLIRPATLSFLYGTEMARYMAVGKVIGQVMRILVMAGICAAFIGGTGDGKVFSENWLRVGLFLSWGKLMRWKRYHMQENRRTAVIWCFAAVIPGAGIWLTFHIPALLVIYFAGWVVTAFCCIRQKWDLDRYFTDAVAKQMVISAQNHMDTEMLAQLGREKIYHESRGSGKSVWLMEHVPISWKIFLQIQRNDGKMIVVSWAAGGAGVFLYRSGFMQEVGVMAAMILLVLMYTIQIQTVQQEIQDLFKKCRAGQLLPLTLSEIVRKGILFPVLLVEGSGLGLAVLFRVYLLYGILFLVLLGILLYFQVYEYVSSSFTHRRIVWICQAGLYLAVWLLVYQPGL